MRWMSSLFRSNHGNSRNLTRKNGKNLFNSLMAPVSTCGQPTECLFIEQVKLKENKKNDNDGVKSIRGTALLEPASCFFYDLILNFKTYGPLHYLALCFIVILPPVTMHVQRQPSSCTVIKVTYLYQGKVQVYNRTVGKSWMTNTGHG